MPHMEHKRKFPSAVVMSREAIYIIGGCLYEESEMEVIEVFNPHTKKWRSLEVAFSSFFKQMVAVRINKKFIIALGGQETHESGYVNESLKVFRINVE